MNESLTVPLTIAFVRIVLGLTFAWSFWVKIRDIDAFENSILTFNLLPETFSQFLARFIIMGELVTAIFIFLGGKFFVYGITLAIIFLSVFSLLLLYSILNGVNASCGCFGKDQRPIALIDFIRDVLLVLLGLLGLWANSANKTFLPDSADLDLTLNLYVGFPALITVLIIVYLHDILDLFQGGSVNSHT